MRVYTGRRASATRSDRAEQDDHSHGPATERVWTRGRVLCQPGAQQEPRQAASSRLASVQRRPNRRLLQTWLKSEAKRVVVQGVLGSASLISIRSERGLL